MSNRTLYLFIISFLLISCKQKPKKSIEELPTQVKMFDKKAYLTSSLDSQALLSIQKFGNEIDTTIYRQDIDSISNIIKKEEGQEIFHTKSGILYIIDNYGKGEYPKKGDRLEVKVETTTLDSTNVFSTTKMKQNLQFIVGVGQVVPAWDEVFLNVQEGSKFQIIVPSALSYGKNGIINSIAPNAILKYDITFEKIIVDKKVDSKDQPQLKIKEENKTSKESLPVSIKKPDITKK